MTAASESNTPAIRSEQLGALVRVTIDRPERLNSLTTAALRELAETIRAADTDTTRAIVLTGEGRAFCSGADLSSDVDGDTVAAAAEVVTAIATARPVVVAAVNGPVAGVGVSLVLACDLAIAAESAFFLMPFLPLGLVPDGGATHSLVSRAGAMHAARMVYGGERVLARQAESWGLVGDVVEDDRLAERVDEAVDRLLDAPAAAVHATKRLLRAGEHEANRLALDEELTVQSALLSGEEHIRAREGFLQKRPVSFREA